MLSTRLIIIASLAVARCWTSEVFYDVACPGSNIELQCPDGQEIEVLSFHHGLNTSIDCDEKTEKVEVSEEECFHKDMLGWAKFICDKNERCRLPKPDVEMFECDNAEEFFIQTTYLCKDKKPHARTVEVCEGDTAELVCENGAINILKASYGRFDRHTCTEMPSIMTFCSSYRAHPAVKHMCESENECFFPVLPNFLGKPHNCDHHPKYLRVEYFCE